MPADAQQAASENPYGTTPRTGTSTVRLIPGRRQVRKVSQERTLIIKRAEPARGQILLRLPLSRLVPPVPEPHLIQRHRQGRPQLDYPVRTLDYLQLGTGLIQPVLPPQLSRQRNRTSALDSRIAVISSHHPMML